MMFRPALRTSHRAFCGASSGMLTTLPGRPRSPISSTRSRSLPQQRRPCRRRRTPPAGWRRACRSAPSRIVGVKAGLASASSIMVRSTSSTAVGPSLTMCCAESMAWWKVGKLTTPSTLARGSSLRCSVRLRVKASVPSRAHQQVRQVDAAVAGVGLLALRVEDVQVVAGHAAQHLGPARLDLGAVPSARLRTNSPICARAAAQLRHAARSRAGCRRPARRWRRPRCAPCCRRRSTAAAAAVVAGHAAQRGLRAGGHVHRVPQAVGLELRVQVVQHQAGLHRRRVVRPHRASSTRRKCLLQSMTSAAPTVWPHWLVPPPRGNDRHAQSRVRWPARWRRRRPSRGTNTPTGMIW